MRLPVTVTTINGATYYTNADYTAHLAIQTRRKCKFIGIGVAVACAISATVITVCIIYV